MIRMSVYTILFATLGILLTAAMVAAPGCQLYRPQSQSQNSIQVMSDAADGDHRVYLPASSVESAPAVIRVGGDLNATAERSGEGFRSASSRITTSLPEGYPAPTPPGAIDIKRYPSVRRAGISGKMSPDWGMNVAFFPLFKHIKRREIAMTSPVEMNYHGMDAEKSMEPDAWTMAFLYRSSDLGPAGVDASDDRILIEDTGPMMVLSIGMRGAYRLESVQARAAELQNWLAGQEEWYAVGEIRALFYNGPEADSADKWSEIQIPVRRR